MTSGTPEATQCSSMQAALSDTDNVPRTRQTEVGHGAAFQGQRFPGSSQASTITAAAIAATAINKTDVLFSAVLRENVVPYG